MLVCGTLCDEHDVGLGSEWVDEQVDGWVDGWLGMDDGEVADHDEEDECCRQSVYDGKCVVM